MKTDTRKRKPGGGRKPRYGDLGRMEQKTIRLPVFWIQKLIDDFGTLQNAIESLVKDHFAK